MESNVKTTGGMSCGMEKTMKYDNGGVARRRGDNMVKPGGRYLGVKANEH
jgi:hypothetical protein